VAAALDPFIPSPDVRERFEITIRAPAERVMAVARDFDMQSIGAVRTIVRMREWLTRSTSVARAAQGLVAETRSMGWGVLRDEPGRLYVSGAHCQPWLADVRFHALPAEEFADWRGPDQVKIAWTLEAAPLTPTLTRFASETRAVATDDPARRKFMDYWRWARFGIVAIRLLLLPAVRRAAETGTTTPVR
jgi:hypothetical protein